jgi:hypothetical protein
MGTPPERPLGRAPRRSEGTGADHPKPPPVDGLMTLWDRIKEHKRVQWCAASIALADAIEHGVTRTIEAFEWPHELGRIYNAPGTIKGALRCSNIRHGSASGGSRISVRKPPCFTRPINR